MKKKILSLVFALAMVVSLFPSMRIGTAVAATEDTYIPLEVSGFNKDVVVENTVALSGSLWDYAGAFDGDNEGARMSLYEHRGGSSTYGLPSSRDIGDGKFTLQPYTQNNVLQLYGYKTDSTAKGSLEFVNQTGYPMIAFLGAGGNGKAPFEALITYTDGTQSATLTSAAPDWYVGEYDGFYRGPFGRVKLDNGTTENGNGPNLYAFTIETNQFKAIKSIDFVYTGGSDKRLNIMAVSGVIPANTFTVNYKGNGGGTGIMVNVGGISGAFTLPENGYRAKTGYEFLGWSTSKTGGELLQPGTEITVSADVTLYAQWKAPEGVTGPDTIVDLTKNIINVNGDGTVSVSESASDGYFYYMYALPVSVYADSITTADDFVKMVMDGVDQSIVEMKDYDLTSEADIATLMKLASGYGTGQVFAVGGGTEDGIGNTDDSMPLYEDSIVIVYKLREDNKISATYADAGQNPFAPGLEYAHAYGIYGVYADIVEYEGESGGDPHTHCVCGAADCTDAGHSGVIEWTGVASLSEITTAGYYYLTTDVEIDEPWNPVKDVVLCLNGHVVKLLCENYRSQIYLDKGKFTLTDCDKETEHKFSVNSDGLWVLDENGDKIVTGGVITGGTDSAVDANTGRSAGDFTMYGGNIVGNTGSCGGGVYVQGGQATIIGGSIRGNTATYGGGIGCYTGSVRLFGGVISDNTATEVGGGLYSQPGYDVMGAPVVKNNRKLSGSEYIENNAELVVVSYSALDEPTNASPAFGIYDLLTEGAEIGVTISTSDFFTDGWSWVMGDADPTDYFFSDNTDYTVVKAEVVEGSGEYELRLSEGGESDKPEVDLGTIVNLTESIITVNGNTVTVNKPEGEDEYIYFLTVLPEIYLEGTGMTAEQYVERHMLGVGKSIIDATTLDLTDVPGMQELAGTTQIFVTNLETYESLDDYISGDSVVVVLKLHPDNVKVATYDSAADNPYFGSVGFTTAYAYGIYGVYATRVSAGAGAEVASAELTFTYEETIGAIVAGEELPDLSVLAPEHVVVKDTDGNVLTVVDVYADWLCKAPDLDEGWGWPDSSIAQEGMEYGIRIEVMGDGSYSFGTSWEDLTVLTCQDEKLSVNSAWVGDPNSVFAAIIEMSTVQQPEEPVDPPHEHSYTYTSNNNGTHNGACACGEDAITNEACTYAEGTCSKCGYAEPAAPTTYAVTVTVKEKTEGDVVDCNDATVKLVSLSGEEMVKEQSIGNGMYGFENVADGIYNLVIQRGNRIKTVLVEIAGKNVDLGVVYLPVMEINSKVDITVDVDDDSPIKGALVGGLDALADTIAEEIEMEDGVSVSVEVAMEINAQMSDDVVPEHKEKIEKEAKTQSENLTFLDISIDKTITTKQTGKPDSVKTDPVNDTEILLEIVIPFDTADRRDFAVYRYHELDDSVVQKLTVDKNSDGEYIKVEDGVIKMYVRYFSTYAIGFSEGDEPETPPVTPNIPCVPMNPAYTVSLSQKIVGGKIESSIGYADYGTTVTITVTPNQGYELETLTVTDSDGNEISVKGIGNNKFTFTMPDSKVNVTATFRKMEDGCAKDVNCPIWPFNDAKTTAWYHDGVHYCIENGLMNGLPGNLFDPNGTTTRAQIVTILWRLDGSPVANYAMSFADVAADQWYTEAVRWAAVNGIVEGYSDTVFAPNDAITREQFAAILWRYCQYKGIDVSVGEETNILSYSDAFDVHSWAMDAMQWACGAGVIGGIADGSSMKLDPTGSATRAQVATMLWRFCEEIMEP